MWFSPRGARKVPIMGNIAYFRYTIGFEGALSILFNATFFIIPENTMKHM